MGKGIARIALGAALLAAACKPAPAPVAHQTEVAANVAVPAPAATSAAVAASPLAQWLVGAWSFDTSCATDFIVHYHADGALQNGEDGGRWSLVGDTVTETITERFEMGSEAPQKVDPPETRSYEVAQVGPDKGTLAFRGKKIPIQRC